jgi:lysophospholipase L1-like esterase
MRPGEEVDVRVNSRGFRGPELPARKAAARVVVYGDSFVEGRSTPLEETFAARLQARLSGQRPGSIEVVNAGVTGYGPDQVLARLERELGDLEPELVVLCLYAGNDGGDVVRNKLWRMDAAGRPVRGTPALADELRFALEERTGLRALATVRAASRVLAELRESAAAEPPAPDVPAVLRDCQREHEEALRDPARVTNLFRDHYDADLAALPRSESARYKRRLLAAVIAAAGGLAASRSVPLLLVAIPAESDVADTHAQKVDAAAYPDYRPSGLTDVLAEIASEAGVPLVDLFAPFRERRAAGLFYPLDGHWNAVAQDLAARMVAERIAADPLLP